MTVHTSLKGSPGSGDGGSGLILTVRRLSGTVVGG